MSKTMNVTRKCAHCGKEFTPQSGCQKYCCEQCADTIKQNKKKQKREMFKAIEPMAMAQCQEYLTFAKAAILMGCSRQYVYKLVGQGRLKASRLSRRMSLIKKSDIEELLDASPYERVLPMVKPKGKEASKKKGSNLNKPTAICQDAEEILDYYSGEDVMRIYKIKQSWLYTRAKANRIPVCRIAGRTYYSKRHIDEHFGGTDVSGITEWLTTDEVASTYSMLPQAVRSYVNRHRIPSKREYGKTYYSKQHLDELRRTDLVNDERYMTVDEVKQIYGLTATNISYIVRANKVEKVKVGVRSLLLKTDIERVMNERKLRGLQG